MAIEAIAQNPMVPAPLFLAAVVAEIGGDYLIIWLWLREKKTVAMPILGGITLFLIWNNSNISAGSFWKSLCSIRGIFVIASILWGRLVDKKPDRYEIIGSVATAARAVIIFYSLR